MLEDVFRECKGISEFLERFVMIDEDDVHVEGLQLTLLDIDDPDRCINFVRLRCKNSQELGFHISELKKGSPYKRRLIPEESKVMDTYDFFTLLQQMHHDMPSFIHLSAELKEIIRSCLGTYNEDEDPEDEGKLLCF